MNRLIITMAGGVASLIATGAAEAAPPAWCKGAAVESPDLQALSSNDVRDVVKAFVRAECAPTPEVDAQRGEIEAARQQWSRRLGMTEADWADAVPYAATRDDFFVTANVSVKSLGQATPIDQYLVIKNAGESASEIDPLYAADMFEPNLSESGRLAFLQTTCLHTAEPVPVDAYGMTGTEVAWAICQADLERINVARLFEEVRADTAHDGAIKMKLRVGAYDVAARSKAHAAEVQQMVQRDDANKKLFEIAGAARAAWAAGPGKNGKLLELVLAMDSAAFSQSRKLLDGCAETTRAALAEAVAAIPAKAFADKGDARKDEVLFASHAAAVLGGTPVTNLAAIAALRCSSDTELSQIYFAAADNGPPSRGPRNMALARLATIKLTYDKVGASLSIPHRKPYGRGYPDGAPQGVNRGGEIHGVARAGDMLTVTFPHATCKATNCVKSHDGKVVRIRPDGTIERETICEKFETSIHDCTPEPVKVSAKYAGLIKPGAVFAAIAGDVIAVWPSTSAKAPSFVLGAAVK